MVIIGGVGGFVLWGIMVVLLGVYLKIWELYIDVGWVVVVMVFIFILMYGCMYVFFGWVLLSEVFFSVMRFKGVVFFILINWICNFIVGVVMLFMFELWGFGIYIFYGGWCGLVVVWVYFFVLEIKGKMFE